MSLKDAERINGKKRRSFQLPDGTYSDPYEEYDIFSRTFMPKNTKYIEADDDEGVVAEIFKDAKIEFSDENISKESKHKLKVKGIKTKEDKAKPKPKVTGGKLIALALLLSCLGLNAQRSPINWKKTGLSLGISLSSVALEMTGDALNDMGKAGHNVRQMQWGHTLQATGYGVLFALPFIRPSSDPAWRDVGVLSLSYLGVRYFSADAFYNMTRGLPLLYAGTVTDYDNALSQMPPGGRAFSKVIALGFSVGININHW